jgi:hypothetical protein
VPPGSSQTSASHRHPPPEPPREAHEDDLARRSPAAPVRPARPPICGNGRTARVYSGAPARCPGRRTVCPNLRRAAKHALVLHRAQRGGRSCPERRLRRRARQRST